MNKIHKKNGFEYKCEKTCFNGNWQSYWYFKPIEQPIFINYQCEKFKTLKADIEVFISNPDDANKYYFEYIKRNSDVEAAKLRLKEAEQNYQKVNSPDFDLRGNNPNRVDRAKKKADMHLLSAESSLERAIKYTEILNKHSQAKC